MTPPARALVIAAFAVCAGGLAAALVVLLGGSGTRGAATRTALTASHSAPARTTASALAVATSAATTTRSTPVTATSRSQRAITTTRATRATSTASAASTTTSQRTSGAAAAHGVIAGNDDASLHLVRASGSTLFEEGHAEGTLPGSMRARLHVGATFSGTFVISTPNGTIEGRGSATPHGGGRIESFAGTGHIIGGTGRYSHAHGSSGFFGTFDRRTYAVVIQTRGSFSY
jgi:hypothetical protein